MTCIYIPHTQLTLAAMSSQRRGMLFYIILYCSSLLFSSIIMMDCISYHATTEHDIDRTMLYKYNCTGAQ